MTQAFPEIVDLIFCLFLTCPDSPMRSQAPQEQAQIQEQKQIKSEETPEIKSESPLISPKEIPAGEQSNESK